MNFVKLNEISKTEGFSLAEMMVVVLILSLVMVAFVPVITRQGKTSSSYWKYAPNNSDIYYGLGDTQSFLVGADHKDLVAGVPESTRLLLNTTSNFQQDDISFRQMNTSNSVVNIGKLLVNGGSTTPNYAVGLGNVTLGAYSTALGYSAKASGANSTSVGNSTASGAFSTAIGYGALAANNRAIAIGAAANASNANSTVLGPNTSTSTYTGSAALGTDSSGTGAAATASNQIVLGAGTHTVYIKGALRVGTNIAGNLQTNSTACSYVVGNATTGLFNYYTDTSDIRLKRIVGKFNDGLNKIRQLKVYNYVFKKDKTKTPHVGVVAQELQKVFPTAVSKNKSGYLVIRQSEILYSMVNAIKELNQAVQYLKKSTDEVEKKIKNAENKVIGLINFDKTTDKKIKDLESQNKKIKEMAKENAVRDNKFEFRLKEWEKQLGKK